ncbi:MAG: RluA family pseudouridine synthase [Pseudomonadota bacterium]
MIVRRAFVYVPPASPHLAVLHHDDDILVLDKPSGLLTVPGKTPDLSDCLEARAQAEFPGARIVHRLDMSTSGVIVLALNRHAHRHVGLQFEKRRVDKTYIARVAGQLRDTSGVIDAPLICDWPNRPRQMIDFERGKPAQTAWKTLDIEAEATRVRLKPRTGRSHQLRVHLMSIGHPILGDEFYAPDDVYRAADRLQLHAETLGFKHPANGRDLSFHAPCPF